jgi:hypothetical protein
LAHEGKFLALIPPPTSAATIPSDSVLVLALSRQTGIDPILLAFGIVAHVRVSLRRQFTGGVI